MGKCLPETRIECERRLTRIETKLDAQGENISCILSKVKELQKSNGTQNTHIALLQSEARRQARFWGLIAGGTGTVIAGIVLWLVTK